MQIGCRQADVSVSGSLHSQGSFQNVNLPIGAAEMRDRDIEPLELRDFLIIAALMAAVLLVLWATASAVVKDRQHFEAPPVVAR
jgi:hypothetical protein